ncbi:hypothetical protein BT96DRAFT_871094 [Gymnopus androsaceus JB14]|uniref:Uncharacterized protein n=1 Tax=Gymnopus androsaceus JB14 TaxID=1447944 RepID=A0A6A4IQ10_9AGAR|nr:hypothetical protein BT96DRAFT_871094 [Gymnopus androsaceus JB14]
MFRNRALRFAQGRTFISSLFSFTFFATVITVSASNVLPCPARPEHKAFADSDKNSLIKGGEVVVVSKKTRKWIEEKPSSGTACT